MDNIVASSKPELTQVGLSLSAWIFMFLGLIVVRAELHPWVNTVLLTAVYPMYIWFMSKNNIMGLISMGSMFAMVIGATLFMTLLLEAMPKSKFSQDLKKNLKEFGKKPKETGIASMAIVVSLAMGAVVSYAVTSENFIRIA